MSNPPADLPGKMLNLDIPNRVELYRSYIGFLKYGGLFAPNADPNLAMGDEVLLIAKLPDLREPKYLRTTVAWINYTTGNNGQAKGVGLAFGDDEVSIDTKKLIEDLLPGALLNERPTYTL
ncbi:PilZ domain-containing protein [Stenoxybacter acetivorans]|uniref:PilZ domain-containing protein n=1 Tax=Stenoxybacter acetivorans TaxID=422441 RepID=UPI00056248CC|nr:PilZ domain-containing protein [Stenoxybacter acetivorans]